MDRVQDRRNSHGLLRETGSPAPARTDGIDVIVLDDHELVRQSLQAILSSIPSVRSVRGVSSAAELFLQPAGSYGAVVVDLVLPDMPGTSVLRKLSSEQPTTILMAITGHADPGTIRRAQECGPVTCLSKSSTSEELRICMHAALGGAVLLDSESRATLARGSVPAQMTPLSRRELQVLELLASGLSARQIGEQLIISEATVRAHRHRIYSKLGVNSRREAAELLHGRTSPHFDNLDRGTSRDTRDGTDSLTSR